MVAGLACPRLGSIADGTRLSRPACSASGEGVDNGAPRLDGMMSLASGLWRPLGHRSGSS
jgi:hypothetical protein